MAAAAEQAAEEGGVELNPIHQSEGYDEVPLDEEEKREASRSDGYGVVVEVEEQPEAKEEEEWVEAAIEELGYGMYQKRLMVLSAALWAADSMEVSLLSFLYQCVGASWGLNAIQAATLVSVVFAGELVGALVAGPMGDACGRKPASIAAAALVAVAGLATAAAPNLWIFVFLRALVGVGVGALAVPFDLMAEFLPASTRGEKLTLLEFAWAGGAVYATAASYATQRWSWRALVVACGLPFVVVLAGVLMCLDESPRWLAAHGRTDEAKAVLATVARVNGEPRRDDDAVVVEARQRVETLVDHVNDMRRQIARLAAPDLRARTGLVWIVWLGFGLNFYGVSLLVTRLFGRDPDKDFECKFRYGFIFAITTAQFAGTAALLALIDRLGRVRSQTLPYFITAAALLPLALLDARPGLPHLACLYLALGAQMMASSASWVHVPELYPTDVRSTAHSLALTVSRLSAFTASYLVDSSLHILPVVLVLAAASLAAAAAAARLPETQGAALD